MEGGNSPKIAYIEKYGRGFRLRNGDLNGLFY